MDKQTRRAADDGPVEDLRKQLADFDDSQPRLFLWSSEQFCQTNASGRPPHPLFVIKHELAHDELAKRLVAKGVILA